MIPISDVRKRSIASIRTTTFKVRKRVQKPKLCSEPTGGAGHIRHSPFKRPAMRPAISNQRRRAPAIFRIVSISIGAGDFPGATGRCRSRVSRVRQGRECFRSEGSRSSGAVLRQARSRRQRRRSMIGALAASVWRCGRLRAREPLRALRRFPGRAERVSLPERRSRSEPSSPSWTARRDGLLNGLARTSLQERVEARVSCQIDVGQIIKGRALQCAIAHVEAGRTDDIDRHAEACGRSEGSSPYSGQCPADRGQDAWRTSPRAKCVQCAVRQIASHFCRGFALRAEPNAVRTSSAGKKSLVLGDRKGGSAAGPCLHDRRSLPALWFPTGGTRDN